jgi:energy-coupling factor transporter transmembrane protein EcfT
MKPIAVLTAGTISLIAAIVKYVFQLPTDWVWIMAPLWVPMLVAYLSFVWIVLHSLALGQVVQAEPAKAPDTNKDEDKVVRPKFDLSKAKK